MSSAKVQSILDAFGQIGRGAPVLIHETHDDQRFGNARVTLELDGLRFHVVDERTIQTLEVGLKLVNPVGSLVHPALGGFVDGGGEPTCPLEVLAVVKKWITLDQLRSHYGLDGETFDYDKTETLRSPFYELCDAVSLLEDGDKWDQLVEASNSHRLQLEAGEIEAVLQEDLGAQLRA